MPRTLSRQNFCVTVAVSISSWSLSVIPADARQLTSAELAAFHDAKPLEIPLGANTGKYNGPSSAVIYDVDSGTTQRQLLDQSNDNLPNVESGPIGGGLASFFGPISPADFRIARLIGTRDSGNYTCSGTLIGSRYVLTAGHCVHAGSGGAFYSNIQVAFGYDNGKAIYGPYKAVKIITFSGWSDSGDNAHDIAMIVVNYGLPDGIYPKYGMHVVEPNCSAVSGSYIPYERRYYSSTYQNDEKQAWSPGEDAGCHLGMIVAPYKTGAGSSGSAEIDLAGQFIFAVHSQESVGDNALSYDALLTTSKICFMTQYMSDPNQNTVPTNCTFSHLQASKIESRDRLSVRGKVPK